MFSQLVRPLSVTIITCLHSGIQITSILTRDIPKDFPHPALVAPIRVPRPLGAVALRLTVLLPASHRKQHPDDGVPARRKRRTVQLPAGALHVGCSLLGLKIPRGATAGVGDDEDIERPVCNRERVDTHVIHHVAHAGAAAVKGGAFDLLRSGTDLQQGIFPEGIARDGRTGDGTVAGGGGRGWGGVLVHARGTRIEKFGVGARHRATHLLCDSITSVNALSLHATSFTWLNHKWEAAFLFPLGNTVS